MSEQQDLRQVPQSDLDFNMLTTNPVWGSPQVNKELQARLSTEATKYDKDGNAVITKESLWGLLNFYTRDIRLGNLSKFDEIPYVQHYLDLAGDLLQANAIEAFLVALSRAATKIELSQSKNGFLRRRMSTFTKESYSNELEPKQKTIFGANKKQY